MDILKPATDSSSNLFCKPEVLVTFDNSFEQEILPVTLSNAHFRNCADNRSQPFVGFAKIKVDTDIGKVPTATHTWKRKLSMPPLCQ